MDAKRATLRPPGFAALGELVAGAARAWRDRRRRDDDGRRPGRLRGARRRRRRQGVLRRKETKAHGLQRRVEGPLARRRATLPGRRGRRDHRRLDAAAIEALQARAGVVGVVSVLDCLAGGGERIERRRAATLRALATIDDVYPDRPDR